MKHPPLATAVTMTNMLEELVIMGVPRGSLDIRYSKGFSYNSIVYTHDFSYLKLSAISICRYPCRIYIDMGPRGWNLRNYEPSYFIKKPKTVKEWLDKAVELTVAHTIRKKALDIARDHPMWLLREFTAAKHAKAIVNQTIGSQGLGDYIIGTEKKKEK